MITGKYLILREMLDSLKASPYQELHRVRKELAVMSMTGLTKPAKATLKEIRNLILHLDEQLRVKARILEVRGKDKIMWKM